MAIITKAKAIETLISNIEQVAGSIVVQVSTACIAAAFHTLNTGDPVYVNRLCDASTKVAGNKVRRWFHEVCADVMTWNSTTKKFGAKSEEVRKQIDRDEYGKYLLAAKNYIELHPDPAFKPFSTVGMLNAILSKFDNMKPEDKANAKHNFVGIEQIRKLAESLATARPVNNANSAKIKGAVGSKKKKVKDTGNTGAPAAPADYIEFGPAAVH